jgi:PIN domain nuclease of toxin-antitoxin system
MKLLIDTHILLWWLSDDALLPGNARQLISTPENAIFVSHASLWEIQIKDKVKRQSSRHYPTVAGKQFPATTHPCQPSVDIG